MIPLPKSSGNTHAQFYKLYYDYYEKMLRYAVTVFSTRGAPDSGDGRAEEVVQDAFVYAWANQEKLYAAPNLERWLFKVLYYKILERIRDENKWSRNINLIKQICSTPQVGNPYEMTDISLLEVISDEDYQLLKKLYIDGATYLDLCKEYHLTKAALGCRIHRIKNKVREKFINFFDE